MFYIILFTFLHLIEYYDFIVINWACCSGIIRKAAAEFTNNLYAMLKPKSKNQIDVAKDLHIGTSTFSSWCTGIKMPLMDKIELLANYFTVNKSDLLKNKKSTVVDLTTIGAFPYNPIYKIPALGGISARMPMYAFEQIESYIYVEYNGCAEYLGLRVHGDSMNVTHISTAQFSLYVNKTM